MVHLKQKLIFIKTFKTGGTSTEAMLQQALWGGQVMHNQRWVLRPDGFVTPRSDGFFKLASMSRRDKSFVFFSSRYPYRLKMTIGYLTNHSSPEKIRRCVGERIWNYSHKIVNVRNPYSLMVSWHFWRGARRGLDRNDIDNEMAFSDFVHGLSGKSHWQEKLPKFTDNSWRFIRQESLDHDIREVANEIGINIEQTYFFKSDHRPTLESDYSRYYSKTTRQLVAARYQNWLDAYGYDF